MRLLSFVINGNPRYGAATANGVVDLSRRFGSKFPDLRSLIAGEGLDEARAVAAEPPDYALDDLALLPPVARPEKIWCIGVNYSDRNAEYKDGSDLPRYPSLFANLDRPCRHRAPLERPRVSEQLDYEGEIALVIGKPGRHIPREQAVDTYSALTVCNEGTVRDWLHHGKFNVTQGKNFDRSGAIGPWIVTADELDPRGAPGGDSGQRRGPSTRHDREPVVPVRLSD